MKKILMISFIILISLSNSKIINAEYIERNDNVFFDIKMLKKMEDSVIDNLPIYGGSNQDNFNYISENIKENIEYRSFELLKGDENFNYDREIVFDLMDGEILHLSESSFMDSISLVRNKPDNLENILIIDEAIRWATEENITDNFSFMDKQQIINVINNELDKYGIDPNDYNLQIFPISKKTLEKFQTYYNDNYSEQFNGELDLVFDDYFLIRGLRIIDGKPFLQGEIGNADNGTQVHGEYLTFVLSESGVILTHILNYYDIDQSQTISVVEQNDKKLLDLIENKFNNLLVVDEIFIDSYDVIYAPFPINEKINKVRVMQFEPIWIVNYRIKNSQYVPGDLQKPEFFYLEAYFKIRDNKEILR